jgi:hypothetical protein
MTSREPLLHLNLNRKKPNFDPVALLIIIEIKE